MSRHENVNQRLKAFAVLRNVFRCAIVEHPRIFKACINLVQIAIENGEPLPPLNNNL